MQATRVCKVHFSCSQAARGCTTPCATPRGTAPARHWWPYSHRACCTLELRLIPKRLHLLPPHLAAHPATTPSHYTISPAPLRHHSPPLVASGSCGHRLSHCGRLTWPAHAWYARCSRHRRSHCCRLQRRTRLPGRRYGAEALVPLLPSCSRTSVPRTSREASASRPTSSRLCSISRSS